MKSTLHLLGVPHTISFDPRYSHCAFTTKVNRFVPMMQSVGYKVLHYGTSRIKKDWHIPVLLPEELEIFTGPYDPESPAFIGAADNKPLYKVFNRALLTQLKREVQPHDIVCMPFGWAHDEAVSELWRQTPDVYFVETGIGYEDIMPGTFHIFESSAWMHYHYGKRKASADNNRGNDYDWVIPNYFDLTEWKLNTEPGEYVLYYGRIAECKGLNIVWEIAKRRPDLKFVVCGQGDATPWLTLPNIEYRPPVHGPARSDLLGKAITVLCPTRYVEPFGGVAVEAMLCGRPVLASVFGAFEETLHPRACFQCRTLKEWLVAIDWCSVPHGEWFHREIRKHAEQFDMFKIAEKYDRAFQQISDLQSGGWYARV